MGSCGLYRGEYGAMVGRLYDGWRLLCAIGSSGGREGYGWNVCNMTHKWVNYIYVVLDSDMYVYLYQCSLTFKLLFLLLPLPLPLTPVSLACSLNERDFAMHITSKFGHDV